MLTEVQKKNYVPTENLMPSEQIDAHTKPGYIALKVKAVGNTYVPTADGKMYVRDVVMPCPRCGVKSSLRSWDSRRALMFYHCEGCGNDLALTWTEHVVMKLTGKLRWTKSGGGEKVLTVPENFTNFTPPEDPNSTTWDSVAALTALVTGEEAEAGASGIESAKVKEDTGTEDGETV